MSRGWQTSKADVGLSQVWDLVGLTARGPAIRSCPWWQRMDGVANLRSPSIQSLWWTWETSVVWVLNLLNCDAVTDSLEWREANGSDHRFIKENRMGKKAGWTRIQKSWVYSQTSSLIRFMNLPTREEESGLAVPRGSQGWRELQSDDANVSM